ncbi:MAG: HD domain-containing phosphohydrolase [Saccharofermentanales bacterium]
MGEILSIGLVNNAALLLALSVIYEIVYYLPSKCHRFRPLIDGMLTSLVCFIIMKMPFNVMPGLFFDTRSILLSVTAVLFGPIPAGITAITAVLFRISIGGIGTLPGIAVIVSSTLIGLVWRRYLLPKQKKWRWVNMYGMSIAVHVTMLACMLLLPYPENLNVVRTISLPVLVIYPVASMLLSVLILNQQERRTVQEKLEQSEDKFKYFFSHSGVGKSITMVSGEMHVNNAFCVMLGYPAEELEGMNWRDITHPDDIDLVDREIKALLSREKELMRISKRYIRKDGSILWADVTTSARWDAAGNPLYFMTSIIDITQQKSAEAKLLHYSYRDHLTDIYNRRYFEEQLRTVDSAHRLPISIIMCDINGLKLVNDTFGHASGDKLIRIAADVISKVCRPDDIVARIGGDEFAVILPATDAAEAAKVVDRIKVLSANFKVFHIELSISMGIGTMTAASQKISETVTNAENDMYKHKMYEQSSIRGKTIDVVMHALFEKSSRESMHSVRVSTISQAIANRMEFDKEMVNRIRIAGLVHDIGKIGVSESVLNKPGPLGELQQVEVRRHTEIGWRILSAVDEFSELATIVLDHHERWDGGGYPSALAGEAIPVEARIIAVADAFDAMTSERSYRTAYSREKAVEELMKGAGTQFDAKVVDVFIQEVLPGQDEQPSDYILQNDVFKIVF